MARQAAIFPGQGAQFVGMGKDVAERFSAAANTFAQADEILGMHLTALCFSGPAERLNATDIQQPAVFTTSVALFRCALEAEVARADDFAAMGGLSLGEYTALHLAGAIAFEDALRLVARRGQLMQAAAESNPSGMVSLMGLDEAQVIELCGRIEGQGPISPANFNCPGQIVVSGTSAACEAAARLGEEMGAKATVLKVAGGFHSELMRSAAEGLQELLDKTPIRVPAIPVIANVDAAYHGAPDEIRRRLYDQLVRPVRWQECVRRLVSDGCDTFWEIGPGRVLTGLMRRIDRSVKTVSVGKLEDFAQVSG